MNRLITFTFIFLLVSACTSSQKTGNNKNISGNDNLHFDKIVVSTSSCFLPCAMSNIIISADGNVAFKGQGMISKKGLFTGTIPQKTYVSLENNFMKANFDSLKNRYQTLASDQQTVTTTFVKNGQIYKTVYDYGRMAPPAFKSAYLPLENLYKKISLKRIAEPPFIPSFDGITDSKLKNGDMVLDIKQSETFLLMDYLRKGKICDVIFKPRFKLDTYAGFHSFYNLETDGRYYTFLVKGKPVTVDIGFNFYDLNAKNWQWQKAREYD